MALATIMSVSAPWPPNVRVRRFLFAYTNERGWPFLLSMRTVTSPSASMPSVTAWTENSSRCVGRLNDGINGFVGRIHWTGADGGVNLSGSVGAAQAHGCGRHSHRAARDLQAIEREHFARLIELVGDQRFEVGVGDGFFLSARVFETLKRLVQISFTQGIPQLVES